MMHTLQKFKKNVSMHFGVEKKQPRPTVLSKWGITFEGIKQAEKSVLILDFVCALCKLKINDKLNIGRV